MRRKDWKPTTSSRLCSAHFEEHAFTKDLKGNQHLKSTAVPTIFSSPCHPVKSSCTAVRRKIFESNNSEVSGSSLLFCKVTRDNKEDSPVDKCITLKSAADYSSVTLTENAKLESSLPHSHTIRRWYSSVSADPGFTVASFTALKSHVEENQEKGKETVCALMMDEMYIHKMTADGFVDIGTGEMDNTLATQALVLMVYIYI
ncbi:hypothetical protein QQF64_003053 [Cirrhinus molitorella]|uniref:THAP-type domain-containing protein n=1 Tax=Cirrhinus molitorella TaxID=172907 RepID=A0ABR3MIY3_9TELE